MARAAADASRIAGGGDGTSAPDDEDERRFFVGAVAVRCGATAADDEEEDDVGNDEDDDKSSDDDDDSADEEEDDGDAVRLASITSASAELMGHGHRADGDCAAAPLAADGVDNRSARFCRATRITAPPIAMLPASRTRSVSASSSSGASERLLSAPAAVACGVGGERAEGVRDGTSKIVGAMSER